jgi:hypothetical protein
VLEEQLNPQLVQHPVVTVELLRLLLVLELRYLPMVEVVVHPLQ